MIPTLNEARNLEHVLGRIPSDVYEVVLVDGWSSDDTVRVAKDLRPDIRVIHQTRRGKGNALACGFAASRGDIIVMLDADGSADPGEIPAFVESLCAGAHFAKGTRFARGGGSADITNIRRGGNWVLNRLVNVAYGTVYTDLCYGYNAFWAACLPHLGLQGDSWVATGFDGDGVRAGQDVRPGDGFEIETLLTTRVSLAGLRVDEVGSFESPRLHGRSNLNAWRDGWRVLRVIASERRRMSWMAAAALDLPEPWEDFNVDSPVVLDAMGEDSATA